LRLDYAVEHMTTRTTALLGATLIVVGLALVPAFWHCSGNVQGWNFVIFALVAAGGSIVGSAAGRRFQSRLAGILATVVVVMAALLAVTALATGSC
jgi:preprotein translocase subunit SecG